MLHIKMNRVVGKAFLSGIAVGISLAWLLEAILVSRGVVSTYLAPIPLISSIVAAFLQEK